MKKLIFSFVIGSVLFLALFLGCGDFTPPDIHENPPATNADSERKDVLALKHLQIPDISEDTLASYVMDFIHITAVSESETGRSVQSAPAVVITKTTKITHEVQTGFAETTADKRSARSVIGPGQIPFYVFTLENQQTGKTGFALTCGDNRIGAVLAVVEEGNYDDADNPLLGIFYVGLNAYIENTIDIYNGITEADIENALNKTNKADRATAPNLPITDVGKIGKLEGKKERLETVFWHQYSPYNDIIMTEKRHPEELVYIAGCGPVAIAIIMAYHGKTRAEAGKLNPYSVSKAKGYTNVKYDWKKMVDGEDDKAIGVLMWEIGLPNNANADYKMGVEDTNDDQNKKKEALTTTYNSDIIRCFNNMEYKTRGSFQRYNIGDIKSSIKNKEPVIAVGYTEKEETTILFIVIPTYDKGHYWVIEGCAELATDVKDKVTGEIMPDYPLDYVYCNMGWRERKVNGWYVSGVFNTDNIPEEANRSAEVVDNFFQYDIKILTGIRPKD